MADVKYFEDLDPLATVPDNKIMAFQSDPKGTTGFKTTKAELSQNVADTTITGLTTTAQNIVDAINELVSGSGGMTFEDLTDQLTTPGKTSLTLSSAPLDPAKVVLVYDGNEARYGTLPDGDFTVSGTTITWNDRDQTLRSEAQGGEIWVRYDINVAPTTYWGRVGADLTPLNVDDNVDMKKGYSQYGEGADTVTTIMTYNNAYTTKPIIQFSPTIVGLASTSTLHLLVNEGLKSSGVHIESIGGGSSFYQTTRNAAFSLNRAIGYLQNGDTGTGTRKLWTDQYDSNGGDLRLIRRDDGTLRTVRIDNFAYDATSYWSRNNTSQAVYQTHYSDNDDVATYYDCFYDGVNVKSSTTLGNVRLWKKDGAFQIDVANGVTAGAAISFSTAISIDSGTADVSFLSTGATKIASGTTAERPSSPGNGMIRYNTTTNKFEGYENGAWANLI